jgi:hypothetical protein
VSEPVLVPVRGPLSADDVILLSALVERLRRRGERVICDARGTCDLGVLDAVARIALLSRRLGTWLHVRVEQGDVARLLDLTGLAYAVRLEVRERGCSQGG